MVAMSAGVPRRCEGCRATASALAASGSCARANPSSAISVSIQPGHTVLHRTCGPWSTAMERVSPWTKALDALYIAIEGSATDPEIDPMLTMTPPTRPISGSTARDIENTPRQLTPTTRSQSASVLSSTVRSTQTPALLTSTVTGPLASLAAVTTLRAAAGSATSAVTHWTSSGRSAGRAPRPQVVTASPSARNRSTTARPIPRLPPVTTVDRRLTRVSLVTRARGFDADNYPNGWTPPEAMTRT